MIKGLVVKALGALFMATNLGVGSPIPTALSADSQVKITWPAATQPIFGVDVEESLDAGITWKTVVKLPPTSTHVNIQNLINGKSYWFRVRWIWLDDSLGVPSQTLVEIPVSNPDPPTGLVATAGTNQIGLSWDHDPNKSITGYEIDQSTDNGNSWTIIQTNTGSVSNGFLVNNLKEGVTYTYRIRAIGFGGNESDFSDSAVAKIASTPTGGYALHYAVKNSKVILTWDKPTDLPDVQSYEISVSGDGGVNWFKIATTAGNVNSAVVPYVIGGSTYQVLATSVEGLTSASQIQLVQTNQIPIPDSSTPQTMPSQPTSVNPTEASASPTPGANQSETPSPSRQNNSHLIWIIVFITGISLLSLMIFVSRSRKAVPPKRKYVSPRDSSVGLSNRKHGKNKSEGGKKPQKKKSKK